MINLKIVFTILILMVCTSGFTQHVFLPENLGDSVNSKYQEVNPLISPDEKTLYFIRANHPENKYGKYNSQDIWYSEKTEDGNWTEARRMPKPFNTIRYNNLLGISQDGNRFYVNGRFYRDLSWKGKGVSVITKTPEGEFSKPKRVKIKAYKRKNRGKFTSISINAEEDIMLLSFSKKWSGRNNNLYVSRKKKARKWSKPKKLRGVNSMRNEYSPSLSSDGKKLYFSRKTSKGMKIYVSERKSESLRKWHKPEQLKVEINRAGFNGYFNTNLKGSYAYFSSTASDKSADIYSVKIFEENPYVLISGKIINQKTSDTLSVQDITFNITGTVEAEIKVDSLENSYSILLPLGNSYKLEPYKDNWTSIPDSIDATNLYEFTEINRNLYLNPLPYVHLKGKILSDDKIPVDSSLFESFMLNGARITNDSLNIDAQGNYQITLPHGECYRILAQVRDHEFKEVEVDLSLIKEFKEIELDLIAEESKKEVITATIKGRIINTITQKDIDSTVQANIVVENFPDIVVSLSDSGYTMKLPVGKDYVLYANAKKHYSVIDTLDLTSEDLPEVIYKNLHITPLEIGKAIKLDNIFFETGQAILRKESFSELDRVINLLQENSSIKVEISGHTDNVGNADSNKELSLNRAKAVTEYLIQHGIDKERITPVGYGMEQPVASNDTEEGRSKNRRVEFKILGK